jgi:hypothetical protein
VLTRLRGLLRENGPMIGVVLIVSLVTGSTAVIAANKVTSHDIKNGTIRMADLSKKVRKKINARHRGPRGAHGATGPGGATGAAGPSNTHQVSALDGSQGFTKDEFSCDGDAPFGTVTVAQANGAPMGNEAAKYVIPNDPNAYAQVATGAYDGLALKDISRLLYSERFENNASPGAAPYLFLRLTGGHIVSFSPAYQDGTYPSGTPVASQGTATENRWQRWNVLQGAVAYDNPGGAPDMTWEQLVAAHGNETIEGTQAGGGGVRFYAGCAGAGGANSTSYLDAIDIEVGGQGALYDFEN